MKHIQKLPSKYWATAITTVANVHRGEHTANLFGYFLLSLQDETEQLTFLPTSFAGFVSPRQLPHKLQNIHPEAQNNICLNSVSAWHSPLVPVYFIFFINLYRHLTFQIPQYQFIFKKIINVF